MKRILSTITWILDNFAVIVLWAFTILLLTAMIYKGFFEAKADTSIPTTRIVAKINQDNVSVQVIDGCEYLCWIHSLTHKGNCTNIQHNLWKRRE